MIPIYPHNALDCVATKSAGGPVIQHDETSAWRGFQDRPSVQLVEAEVIRLLSEVINIGTHDGVARRESRLLVGDFNEVRTGLYSITRKLLRGKARKHMCAWSCTQLWL